MEALRSELITKFTTEVSEGVNIAFKQSDGTKSEHRFWFSANGTVEVDSTYKCTHVLMQVSNFKEKELLMTGTSF